MNAIKILYVKEATTNWKAVAIKPGGKEYFLMRSKSKINLTKEAPVLLKNLQNSDESEFRRFLES